VLLVAKNLLFLLTLPAAFLYWLPLRVLEARALWPTVLGWNHALAVLLGTGALGVYLHCQWLFMRRGRGTPFLLAPPERLVQRGLYRWVRNPMYLAALALVAAEALFLRSAALAIYGIFLACLMQLTVRLHEEGALGFRFGAMYEDYKRAVPRWLPRPPQPQTIEPSVRE